MTLPDVFIIPRYLGSFIWTTYILLIQTFDLRHYTASQEVSELRLIKIWPKKGRFKEHCFIPKQRCLQKALTSFKRSFVFFKTQKTHFVRIFVLFSTPLMVRKPLNSKTLEPRYIALLYLNHFWWQNLKMRLEFMIWWNLWSWKLWGSMATISKTCFIPD